MTQNAKLRIVATVPVEFKSDRHRSWFVRISRARRNARPISPLRLARTPAVVRMNWIGGMGGVKRRGYKKAGQMACPAVERASSG